MEAAFLKEIANYGAIALGWIVAWIIWKRLVMITDLYISLARESIGVLARIEAKIDTAKKPKDA